MKLYRAPILWIVQESFYLYKIQLGIVTIKIFQFIVTFASIQTYLSHYFLNSIHVGTNCFTFDT